MSDECGSLHWLQAICTVVLYIDLLAFAIVEACRFNFGTVTVF